MKSAKVAIFGGSFDPVHIGHIEVMKKALEELDMDRLIVVPTYISPFKKGHAAPARKRLEWLKRATAFDPRIEVSDYEIKRDGKSFSYDTVKHFKHFFDTIYLIIGADNLPSLKKWHRFKDLDKMVKWVVATRSGQDVPEGFIRLDVDVPISSTELRSRIDPKWIPEPIREEVVKYYNRLGE
ncbi:MAG: nicotinate (nicotinamide) nucleotide adenylyltransferase [Hydrogenimonas sp.]|nr:nicotinate (nicotinamide) nucleotide adenylyltransferase [Hydrogenimonas sp.]